jgi:hypothetical protein
MGVVPGPEKTILTGKQSTGEQSIEVSLYMLNIHVLIMIKGYSPPSIGVSR